MLDRDEIRRDLAEVIHKEEILPYEHVALRLIVAPTFSEEDEAELHRLLAEAFPNAKPYTRLDERLIGGFTLWINELCLNYSVSSALDNLADDLRAGKALGDWESYHRGRVQEMGYVTATGDGIAHVRGLRNGINGELVRFGRSSYGIIMNLEEKEIVVLLLSPQTAVRSGDLCYRTGRAVEVPSGTALLGRVVSALGEPIDGGASLPAVLPRMPIEAPAAPIIDRAPVSQPLATGITAIDALVPVGRGQRELLIGDRQTGKSTVALDTIIQQKGQDVACIYVAIGQKRSTIAHTVKLLESQGALAYTTVVSASSSDTEGMQYIAPYAGCAMAEGLMYEGRNVLIVYDDLTRHAEAYRAISLLLRRPPGREAYPGDVFYLHSRLLERSAKLSPELGGGSMTALPIVETQAGDISSYIPTNLISITDGQIFFDRELFLSGQRPAINVGLSVSRVGGAAQTTAMRKIAGPLRTLLAQYREQESFAQFASDIDAATQKQLAQGKRLFALLRQGPEEPRDFPATVTILALAGLGAYENVDVADLNLYTADFIDRLPAAHPALWEVVSSGEALSDKQKKQLLEVWQDFLPEERRKDLSLADEDEDEADAATQAGTAVTQPAADTASAAPVADKRG